MPKGVRGRIEEDDFDDLATRYAQVALALECSYQKRFVNDDKFNAPQAKELGRSFGSQRAGARQF